MDVFDIRIKNHLFPDLPKSYSDCVDNALQKAGVRAKPKKRFSIVSISIAAASIAASIALIVLGAIVFGRAPENRPGSDGMEGNDTAPVPMASSEPGWNGTTQIIAAKDPDGHCSDADAERYGHIILSFLQECGESEPDELWILRVRPLHETLPTDDTASYIASVLVLAQSRFGESDGPDLYCIQGHNDGEVLWGTQDGSLGPQRVLGASNGQKRWILFGTNEGADGTLGHIKAGYLTGGEDGTDIEFSAFLTNDESRRPFENSIHFDALSEYYLIVVGEPDLDYVLDLSLFLVTDRSNYAFPIRDNVPELTPVSAADAERIRENIDNLSMNTAKNGETTVYNLTNQSLDAAEAYAEAILRWLEKSGTKPDELWICGAALFAFPQDEPKDDAYVLALYEFDGETGPELFYYRNESILWQTTGYDPYCVNTVYDPELQENCLFGFSPAYDNGAIAMEKGQFTAEQADTRFADDSTVFYPERPLAELPKLLSGSKHTEWMRECFICPYPKAYALVDCVFTTEDGRTLPSASNYAILLASACVYRAAIGCTIA